MKDIYNFFSSAEPLINTTMNGRIKLMKNDIITIIIIADPNPYR